MKTLEANQQLELFDDLPTTEELKEIEFKFDSNQNHQYSLAQKAKAKRDFLIENGFVEGLHFTYKEEYELRNITINTGYFPNYKKWERKIECFTGQCVLRFWDYHEYWGNKAPSPTHALFDVDKGKISCYSLVESSRYVKPSTILEKIQDRLVSTKNRYERVVEQINAKQYTVDKYSKLYPEAKVEIDKHDTLVTITFKSGSYIKFYNTSTKDAERVKTVYDACIRTSTDIETLGEYFNNQPARR